MIEKKSRARGAAEEKPRTVRRTGAKAADAAKPVRKAAPKADPDFAMDESRRAALARFPEGADGWMKANLGIGLADLQTSDLYDVAAGRYTSHAHTLTVVPLVFDREKRKEVEFPAVKTNVSFVLRMPEDLSKESPRIVATTGVLPLRRERSDEGFYIPDVPEAEPAEAEAASEKKPYPEFSPADRYALEGVGIHQDEFFPFFRTDRDGNEVRDEDGRKTQVFGLTYSEKRHLRDGDPVELRGSVRTAFGFVETVGRFTLNGGKASFEPYPLPERLYRSEFESVDTFKASRKSSNFNLAIPFNRKPDAPCNMLEQFGVAGQLVRGYMKMVKWEEGKPSLQVTADDYVVAVNPATNSYVNRPWREKVMEKNEDGTPIMVENSRGEKVQKYHYRYALPLNSGDSVRLGGVDFPLDANQAAVYRKGGFVFVDGAQWKDPKTGEVSEYTAAVCGDLNRGGFPKQLSPEKSVKVARLYHSYRKLGKLREMFGIEDSKSKKERTL